MRDIGISIVVLIGLFWTVRFPYVGVLLWTWVTLMVPHQLAFGFSRTFQINLLVAVVTLGSWLLNDKERKFPPLDTHCKLLILYFLWMTFNTFQAVEPDMSWRMWDRVWRVMLLGVLISTMATNKVRIHAVVMVDAMSLLWYGVKGGGFTLMNGGGNHVQGPADSPIGDNNQLALAILMVLPLANYLRLYTVNWAVSRAYLIAIGFGVLSVLGSYSRGAFIALGGLAVLAMFRAKRKWLYPLVAAGLLIPAMQFMPENYFSRINTIQDAQSDGSFQGRLDAWGVAWGYAVDHFPFGAGFHGCQTIQVFSHYAPGKETHAAHSIFFQTLGDNGFIGLFIFLALLFVAFRNSMTIRKYSKGNPELGWAYDLSGMIQLSLFVYCLGGSALSFAYYDNMFILTGLLSVMREQVLSQAKIKGWRKGMGRSQDQGALSPTLVTE